MHHLTYGQSFILTGLAIIALLIVLMAITIYFARRDPNYQAQLLIEAERRQFLRDNNVEASIAKLEHWAHLCSAP